MRLLSFGDAGTGAVVGQAEKKVGECVIGCDAAGAVACHLAVELETSARIADAAAEIGLEVIQVEVIVGEAVLGGMAVP